MLFLIWVDVIILNAIKLYTIIKSILLIFIKDGKSDIIHINSYLPIIVLAIQLQKRKQNIVHKYDLYGII